MVVELCIQVLKFCNHCSDQIQQWKQVWRSKLVQLPMHPIRRWSPCHVRDSSLAEGKIRGECKKTGCFMFTYTEWKSELTLQ